MATEPGQQHQSGSAEKGTQLRGAEQGQSGSAEKGTQLRGAERLDGMPQPMLDKLSDRRRGRFSWAKPCPVEQRGHRKKGPVLQAWNNPVPSATHVLGKDSGLSHNQSLPRHPNKAKAVVAAARYLQPRPKGAAQRTQFMEFSFNGGWKSPLPCRPRGRSARGARGA